MRTPQLFLRFERWFNHRFGWFFTNGNKAIILLLLCSSCEHYDLRGMQPPIVVVAVSHGRECVIVRDAADNYRTMYECYASSAIAASYQPGDTLR